MPPYPETPRLISLFETLTLSVYGAHLSFRVKENLDSPASIFQMLGLLAYTTTPNLGWSF